MDEKVVVKDAASFTTVFSDTLPLGAIDLKMSGNGTKMAVTSFDFIIRVYDLEMMKQVNSFETNSCHQWKVATDFTGNHVYTGAHQGVVLGFDTDSGRAIKKINVKSNEFITSFATNRVGDLVIGNATGNLFMAKGSTGDIINLNSEHYKYIRSIEYSNDCTKLIVTSDDLQVSIYDLAEERCISMLSGHTNTINDLSIHPQNETFATVSADKTLKFWDIRNKSYTSTLDSAHNDILWSCKHSTDGELLYTGSETGYFKAMHLN